MIEYQIPETLFHIIREITDFYIRDDTLVALFETRPHILEWMENHDVDINPGPNPTILEYSLIKHKDKNMWKATTCEGYGAHNVLLLPDEETLNEFKEFIFIEKMRMP